MTKSVQPLIKASDMQTREPRPGASQRVLRGDQHGVDVFVLMSSYPRGVGPPEHRHLCGEVFVVYEGRGVYTVDGVDVIAAAGDFVVVPPNTWRSFRADGDEALRRVGVLDSALVDTEREPI